MDTQSRFIITNKAAQELAEDLKDASIAASTDPVEGAYSSVRVIVGQEQAKGPWEIVFFVEGE